MVAAWDIVAQNYYRQSKDSKTAAKDLIRSSVSKQQGDVPQTCERLYRDFLERRKRRTELEARRQAEHLEKLARESAPKYLDRNPTLNAESQRRSLDRRLKEHTSLHKYLSKIQELDQERKYLMSQAKMVRRVPGQVGVAPDNPLLEELKYIGCPVMNSEALNCLFAFHTRDVIRAVVEKSKEARDLQRHIIAGAEEIQLIEKRKIDEELRPHVKQVVESTLEVIMANEGLLNTELMTRRASGQWEWCYRPILSELITRSIIDFVVKHSAKFEELCSSRRQILFESVVMSLQNLIAALQLDIEMRSMFLRLRIPKLQIRGYRYDLVESLREEEWFRNHVGTTSSLKNNHTINQCVRELVQEICLGLYVLPEEADRLNSMVGSRLDSRLESRLDSKLESSAMSRSVDHILEIQQPFSEDLSAPM